MEIYDRFCIYEWKVNLLIKPKLHNYPLFKDSYATEEHEKYCRLRKYRSFLV